MKPQLQKLAQKIDALSLRERVIVFLALAFALLFLVNHLLLEPQFARQKQLAAQIQQDQATMKSLQSSIQALITARELDPDAANLLRLQALQLQSTQAKSKLLDLQKGLVSPERMSSLLEDILTRNGNLRLIALKTLPAVGLVASGGVAPASKSGATAAPLSPSVAYVYKHGVEITIQGSYADMLRYLTELEAIPWQLYWGKTTLEAGTYPQATLSLTLFTLSLDRKWLNL